MLADRISPEEQKVKDMTENELKYNLNKMSLEEIIAVAYYFFYLSGMSEDEIMKKLKDALNTNFADRHKEIVKASSLLEKLPGMFNVK